MRNSNQILHNDQTILEEKFYRVVHATCPGQKILTGMLMRDLFAVANLLVSSILNCALEFGHCWLGDRKGMGVSMLVVAN